MGIEQSFIDGLDDDFARNPDIPVALRDIVLARVRDKTIAPWLVEAIVSKYGGRVDTHDAWVIAKIWSWITDGEAWVMRIPVGIEPEKDSNVEANQRSLLSLPRPFSAIVESGTWVGDDGILEWSEPITFDALPETADGYTKVVIEPGSASLEIGTTSSFMTFWHLRRSRQLCRWPYRHRFLTLIGISRSLTFDDDEFFCLGDAKPKQRVKRNSAGTASGTT